jgi:hypothetical protein
MRLRAAGYLWGQAAALRLQAEEAEATLGQSGRAMYLTTMWRAKNAQGARLYRSVHPYYPRSEA